MIPGMSCARFARALHESEPGALGPAERALLDEHARTCPACAALRADGAGSSCRELLADLVAFEDGALPTAASERFARHLAGCADCRAYRARYLRAIELTAEAFAAGAEAAPELPEELVRAILARRRAARDE